MTPGMWWPHPHHVRLPVSTSAFWSLTVKSSHSLTALAARGSVAHPVVFDKSARIDVRFGAFRWVYDGDGRGCRWNERLSGGGKTEISGPWGAWTVDTGFMLGHHQQAWRHLFIDHTNINV